MTDVEVTVLGLYFIGACGGSFVAGYALSNIVRLRKEIKELKQYSRENKNRCH